MPYVSTPDTVVVAGLQAQRAAGMEDFQTATHDDFQMGFDASRRTLGYNDRNAALASPVATNRFFAATPDFTAGDLGAAHFILTNGVAVNQVNRLNLDGSAAQSFGGFNSSVSFSNALSTSQIEDLYAVSENAGSLSVPRTNGAPRDLEIHRIGGATSYAAAVTNSGPMASWNLFVEDNGASVAKAESYDVVGGFNGAYMNGSSVTNSVKLAGEVNGGVLPNAATTNSWSEVAQVLPPPERSMKVASGNANPTAPKLGEVTINGVIGAQAGTAPSYTGNPSYANPSGIFPGAGPAGSNPGQTAPAASDGSLTGTAVRTLAAPVPPISAAAAAEVERRGLVPQAATIPRDATNHGWTGVSPYLATAAVPAPLATRNPQSLPAGRAGAIRKLAEAATTNGPPVEPADIHYHLSMPADQVLNEVYGPLVGRTPLAATGPAAADLNKKVITLDTKSPLTKTEAITALETVLGMNGITVVPIGDKSLRAVTDANAATEGGLMISNTAATLPDAGKFSTEIVQLKHADPDQLLAALRSFASASKQSVIYIPSTKSLILRDNAENVKRMLETVEKLDVETSLTTKANVNKPLSKPAVPPPVPQPEVQTRDNAFSTFSLNVSDVSFKLAAASLQNGLMPDAATVRSEEFINAFDYRDSEPAPGAPIGFAAERAGWPFAHNRDLLRFAVKAAAEGRQAGRPLNLVLLLDKSGSMERADRVAIIREALRVLATQLKAQDTVSVVVFARTARLFADGVSGSRFGALAAELEAITPEGGTNLEEAMRLAYETALRHYLASGENRVVVLTDGAANLGDVEPEGLKKRVEANRAQGIALDCFGVGWEDYNDTLLETLSRSGGGRYGFVNTPEEAATGFAGQLAGALRVAASDVKVQVEFNPDRVISWRQIGYAKDQLTKEQFRDNSVKAAQIAVAESGNALYTAELNPAGDGPVCVVYVRYRAPGTSEYFERAWAVPYTGAAPALDKATPAMRLAAASSAFSEWLAGSPYAGEVTLTQLQGYLGGVPEFYGADTRPRQLETMLREARSISGK